MISKNIITFFIISNFINHAWCKSRSGSEVHSTFASGFEDDVDSVKDDLYSLGNDTSNTSDDFTSLASDVESLQDNFEQLALCHQMHPFPFQNCYREISVDTTKSEQNLTDSQFQDYKCELTSALAECINLKTKIYCGPEEADLVKKLTSIFKPQYEKDCNTSGVVKGHLVEFAI